VTTARQDHDAHLDDIADLDRVLRGNAIEGPAPPSTSSATYAHAEVAARAAELAHCTFTLGAPLMTEHHPRPHFLRRTEERGEAAFAFFIVVVGSLAAGGLLHLALTWGRP